MEMPFEEFEQAPARDLSPAQERRLNRRYATGDFGGGAWKTIESLQCRGFLTAELALTEKASRYLFHHGPTMPI